eukprot:CAMPEP_0115046768 /NCGR_PEP_ID=MMETSP0216-20121206/48928_1 /TAXON_ID=223996 /ORGANISM="Protocruzia adherens, Strain Boccale" /LENGTH=317 /DNA_ID=CAMNT_0002429877 /DNA_START=177 /DNA_END=1130 /DNA_ORIENTATION=+
MSKITYLDISFSRYFAENRHSIFEIISQALTSLTSLGVRGCDLSDSDLKLISTITTLQQLRLDCNEHMTGEDLPKFPPLKVLTLTYCGSIQFKYLLKLVQKSANQLTKLHIDGESFESHQTLSLLSQRSLREFSVMFANEIQDDVMYRLADITDEWRKIKFRKAHGVSDDGFRGLFSKGHCQLVSVAITESSEISDMAVICLAANAPRLRHINLSWCFEIHDVSVLALFNECRVLEKVELIGLKNITHDGFPIDPKRYLYLQSLNLTQCNKIQDTHLWQLFKLYPNVKMINYFGELPDGWQVQPDTVELRENFKFSE